MQLTGDNLLIKEINKTLVLKTIKDHSPISRTEVNRLSGLNKGTVSTIVNGLIKDHFIYEIGSGKSSGGRKPVMLMFNNQAGYAIGINVEIKQITAILTDLNGSIIERVITPLTSTSFDYVYLELKDIIKRLLLKTNKSKYGIVGIGIGFPGTVNAEGVIQMAPTLGWRNIPLQQMLKKEYNLPVIVSNEAKVGAQGEITFGVGKEFSNILYLSVSYGIGSSIIINKESYKGHQGYSGDVGHTTFDINGDQCECGNIGCWQHYASVKALLKMSEQITSVKAYLKEHNLTNASLDILITLSEEGNQDIIQLFEKIGRNIGLGLSNLIHTLNPELVVIGGKITECEKWIDHTINETIKTCAKLYYQNNVQIKYSKLGDDSIVLGAASIGIAQLFKETRVTII